MTKSFHPAIEAAAFAERLRDLLASKGIVRHGAGAYLARKYKVTTVTANAWLNGTHKPSVEIANAIAQDHGADFAALYFGDAAPDLASSAPIRVPAFTVRGVDGEDGLDPETDVMIPVVDVEVSAGSPEAPPHYELLPTRYQLPYQLNWLHANGARPHDILIMPVRGRSMEPALWHGDKVILHRGRTRVLDGKVYALVMPDGPRVKRLYNRPDGGLRIVSDNPDKSRYPDEEVSPRDMFRVLILGQAIERMGPGGLSL